MSEQSYPYSVDPQNIPKSLSVKQVEYFLLFAVLVAGKSAAQTYRKLNEFLTRIASCGPMGLPTLSPFEIVRFLRTEGTLGAELEASRFGQYRRIIPAIEAVSRLDPEELTLEDLEAVPGIGPKTARFVMLYVDPKFDGVPLDTHILKWLQKQLPLLKVPKSTPPAGERYDFYELMFRGFATRMGLTVRELDTKVWQEYSNKRSAKALEDLDNGF